MTWVDDEYYEAWQRNRLLTDVKLRRITLFVNDLHHVRTCFYSIDGSTIWSAYEVAMVNEILYGWMYHQW